MTQSPGAPTAVGRFRILSQLADGVRGRVLLGTDETGRRAAVRVLPAGVTADPGFRDRFRRDVQLAAGAPPWFAAPVLDADPAADPPWLATAYVDAPSLQTYVGEHGPLGVEGTYALATRMLDGLVALHGAGLVHRNLTPTTVLLAADGPRVVDGGLTAAAGPQGEPVTDDPDYLAPEQVAGQPDVSPAADMFAFGALMVFAATGLSPFGAASTDTTLYRVTHADPDLGPLTGRVREGVAGCLRKDPAQRPTAAQLSEYLRAETFAPEPEPVPTVAARMPAASVRPTRRGRLPFAALAAAVVLAGALAVGAVLFLGGAGGGPGPSTSSAAAVPAPGGATSSPAADAAVVDAADDPRFGGDGGRFASPSRNIVCALTPTQVRCDVSERTWDLPTKPKTCREQVYGTGAVLTGTEPAQLTCGPAGSGRGRTAVLQYGTGVRLGDVVCVSSDSGMQCRNSSSGHGFSVSRGAYSLY